MSSLYQSALGPAFNRLQPELQEYFSSDGEEESFGIGQGVFSVAGCPQPLLRPLLAAGAGEHSFFPEYAVNVPFEIRNYFHLDPFGRNSVTAVRTLDFGTRTRIFEDTSSMDPRRGLIDYVGRHRTLLTDITCSVTDGGRMRMLSHSSRLFLGPLRLTLPSAVDAKAYVEQWWDGDQFQISTRVRHPLIGDVLVYAGAFSYRLEKYDGGLPDRHRPLRWERRT